MQCQKHVKEPQRLNDAIDDLPFVETFFSNLSIRFLCVRISKCVLRWRNTRCNRARCFRYNTRRGIEVVINGGRGRGRNYVILSHGGARALRSELFCCRGIDTTELATEAPCNTREDNGGIFGLSPIEHRKHRRCLRDLLRKFPVYRGGSNIERNTDRIRSPRPRSKNCGFTYPSGFGDRKY